MASPIAITDISFDNDVIKSKPVDDNNNAVEININI